MSFAQDVIDATAIMAKSVANFTNRFDTPSCIFRSFAWQEVDFETLRHYIPESTRESTIDENGLLSRIESTRGGAKMPGDAWAIKKLTLRRKVPRYRLSSGAASASIPRNFPAWRNFIYHPSGRPPIYGEILKNPLLAASYEAIVKDRPAAFYDGRIAKQIVDVAALFIKPAIVMFS